MSLLKAVVFFDVVKVISSNDNSPLHLHALDDSGQDSPTDTHITREGTLLVDVGTLTSLRAYTCKLSSHFSTRCRSTTSSFSPHVGS